MTTQERILKQVSQLPEPMQQEALDFIQFLTEKSSTNQRKEEDEQWFHASISSAMSDTNIQNEPVYQLSDCKEVWR